MLIIIPKSIIILISILNKGDLKMGKVETIFRLDEILALYEIRKVVDVIFSGRYHH